jgi:hypothetical protein
MPATDTDDKLETLALGSGSLFLMRSKVPASLHRGRYTKTSACYARRVMAVMQPDAAKDSRRCRELRAWNAICP